MEILLSKQKIQELKEELNQLKSSIQRHHEDEHENIKMSRREAASFDVVIGSSHLRLKQLEEILKKCEILPEKVDSEKTVLGSWVKVKEGDGEIRTYRLVHPIEADPSNNLLSVESSLGKKLLSKKVGDKLQLNDNIFKIVGID